MAQRPASPTQFINDLGSYIERLEFEKDELEEKESLNENQESKLSDLESEIDELNELYEKLQAY